ncbi:MAG TPA: hypothetical protein VMU65_06640 [Candidatus Saccharimonadales bacterium]|nr:hypothetical protein [Candidatus Saccharimonadales bacterium]
MLRTRFRASAIATGAVLALATSAIAASAHAVFTAGEYRVAIGWQNEPSFGTDTFVGEQNAIQVYVDIASAGDPKGTPVSTLNGDCTHPDFQVTVTVGSTTSSPFCPAPVYDGDTGNGRLDEYDYPMIPTVVGAYIFHIFGTIDGTPIDQRITSGPTTFDSVADSTSVEFPVAVPAVAALSTKVGAVNQRAEHALAAAQSAAGTAGSAKTSAAGATLLAGIAIVVAVLLSALNVGIGLRRRRP